MNKPSITMTHVCQSWRNVLLSTPSLWTQIDLSARKAKQAKGFLGRSGNQLLDIYQSFNARRGMEPFLSTTLPNIHRLRWLKIETFSADLEHVLARFTESAPELKYLYFRNNPSRTRRDMELRNTIFEGRLPKLTSLSLFYFRTDFCDFNFLSLTRLEFTAGTITSVQDLKSFFERCPSLELVYICLNYLPKPPTAPPKERVRLAALKKLRLDKTACTGDLLDHLILPTCTEVILDGRYIDDEFNQRSFPMPRIHPSSIDHLPVTRGITKAVVMPHSCVFSGPNGNLRFWCLDNTYGNFDAEFFTSFSPISVSEITELWIGRSRIESYPHPSCAYWRQTPAGTHGAFGVLKKVEDLTIVNCETEHFFTMLGSTVDDSILLLGLQRLTVYVWYTVLDVPALIRCAKARKEHSRPLLEVTIVWEEPGADFVQEVESLREFVGEVIYRIGELAPELPSTDESFETW